MALAIGGSTNTVAPHGQFWVDVRDHGARAGISFDNGPAFQAAHDALAAKLAAAPSGQNWKGTVFIPGNAQAYNVATTTYIDSTNIVFQGEGPGTMITSGNLVRVPGVLGNVACPVFMLGYRRPSTIGGSYAANFLTYRPDLFGKLDNSICNATGQRWGFRTNTNAFVMAHGSPFSHGGQSPTLAYGPDNWAETNTLTIEFAVEGFASGKIPANTILFGVGDEQQHTFPLSVRTQADGQFQLLIQTQAVRFGPLSASGVNGLGAQTAGVQRVTIQVSLIAGTITCWINGVQTYTGAGPSGVHFAENDDYPFLIAASGIWDCWSQTFSDFAVYGLLFSRTLRYNVGTNGSAQVRAIDSVSYATVLDNYRYIDNDGRDRNDGTSTKGLFAYFYFAEPPNVNDPMLFIGGSGGGAQPAFIGLGASLTPGGIAGIGLSDMRLCASRGYGAPVYIDAVLYATLDNLDVMGGTYAVASVPHISNYTVLINRCTLSAGRGDAAIYLAIALARIRDCLITSGGRANMRFRATDAVVDGIFIAGCSAQCQFSIARTHPGDNGGQYTLSNILQDSEGGYSPTRAAIMCEADLTGGYVSLRGVNAGAAPGVPFLILDSGSASQNWPSNVIDVANSGSQLGTAFVQTNGAYWSGTFSATDTSPVNGQLPHLAATGAKPPLRFNDNTYPAPPHGGSWYAGPHRLTVPIPADGQYTEWRCSKTGTYGTSTPPLWVGLNAIQATPQSLATYAMDHTVLATTAYGGSSYGWYSDGLTASAVQKLVGGLGGQDVSAPTSLQFGLATSTPTKAALAVPSEPSGNGYVRASLTNNLTNFPVASAGAKANATAITWPTLTGAIPGVVGVFVTDQSNRLLAFLQFANPQSYANGATPTIAIGALTFTQTPLNLKGGLTQFGWAKVADCYFGGVTLAPPSTWYVGLNSAHAAASSIPTEPSGNAYARVGLANDSSHWTTGWCTGFYVNASNAVSPMFATPTGSGWGTILGATLFDAATAGNCWFVGDAPNPVVAGAGSTPTVAPGALLISI
jgi:hypothetical protein